VRFSIVRLDSLPQSPTKVSTSASPQVRLQSPAGFWKSGGFRGIYNGLGAVAVGSAPGAALFFSTYETSKPVLLNWQREKCSNLLGEDELFVSHMAAAALGETVACLVRVPTEVVKTVMQTSQTRLGLAETVGMVLRERHHGSSVLVNVTGGLYRGFGMTLFREIPFAVIQFPLYEKFKVTWSDLYRDGVPVNPLEAAACGSLAGAIAGAITTPLDVLKTRTQVCLVIVQ